MSRYSMSQSISSPLDFLAFFCFPVEGISNVRVQTIELLSIGKITVKPFVGSIFIRMSLSGQILKYILLRG